MRTDPDVTRAVRSWLDEGVDRLPERVLDSVLDAVPSTPQRRSWWPAWRNQPMNNIVRVAAVVAAVVVAGLVGIRLLPSGGVGSPAPTASPTPSPSPGPRRGPQRVRCSRRDLSASAARSASRSRSPFPPSGPS